MYDRYVAANLYELKRAKQRLKDPLEDPDDEYHRDFFKRENLN